MEVFGELLSVAAMTTSYLVKLVEDFIADGEHRIRVIERVKASNLEVVRLEAHSFKGACGALGAMEVMYICGIIERYAKVGWWSEDLLERMRREFMLASARLRELVLGLVGQ